MELSREEMARDDTLTKNKEEGHVTGKRGVGGRERGEGRGGRMGEGRGG